MDTARTDRLAAATEEAAVDTALDRQTIDSYLLAAATEEAAVGDTTQTQRDGSGGSMHVTIITLIINQFYCCEQSITSHAVFFPYKSLPMPFMG